MKKLIQYIFFLGLLVGTVWAVQKVHAGFKSLWLDAFVILCVGLPLLVSLPNVVNGLAGVMGLFQSLFSITAGLLTLTLVHRYLTPNWALAALAGMVLPALVTGLQGWRLTQARLNLNNALVELDRLHYTEALNLARAARLVFLQRGIRDGQAEADLIIGLVSYRRGETITAARHLTAAYQYFRRNNFPQRAFQAQELLDELKSQGVALDMSSAGDEEDDHQGLNGQFMLNVVFSIGFALGLIYLWDIQPLKSSVPVSIWTGCVLALLILGYYLVAAARGSGKTKRPVGMPLLLFTLAWLALAVASLQVLVTNGVIKATGFMPALVDLVIQLLWFFDDQPGWLPAVLIAGGLLLALLAVVLASGRSPLGALKLVLGGDNSEKYLKLGLSYLDSGSWKEAIAEFSRVDLVKEKHADRKLTALFGLALASFKEGRQAEAGSYVQELLALDPNHPEGLYLAGYLALADNQLENAEKLWERLYQINPRFQPAGSTGSRVSARYYYSLVLYRKAMALLDRDLDAGAELLSKVGVLGALDEQVAEALIRVHLYRFTQLVRQNNLKDAAQEAKMAAGKLDSLQTAGMNDAAAKKMKAFCYAAQGLVALKQEQFQGALAKFTEAAEEVKSLHRSDAWSGQGGSLLEELLRLLERPQEDRNQVDLKFPRDAQYLSALALLHMAHEGLESGGPSAESEENLAQARSRLEAAVGTSPGFMEGRALLGLIFYYLPRDEAERRKGIEALQSVREYTRSQLVTRTLAKYEENQKRRQDARKAYFDLLQSYMCSSNIPVEQRQKLRDEVLEEMQVSGEYQAVLGSGSLEIKGEKEPTLNEYIQRSALLRAKMQQLIETQSAELSPQLSSLIEQLNSNNQELQRAIENITHLEMQILRESKGLL
ncbi:MAG: hypothetical protein GX491_20685 [Chloroflexi bacterium]|nr:hypothetical protein [Chloroflexota bacterium]